MALIAVIGCRTGEGELADDARVPDLRAAAGERLDAVVDDWDALLLEQATTTGLAEAIISALEPEHTFVGSIFERNRDLLRTLYADHYGETAFVDETGPTESGITVYAALVDADAHGLMPARYNAPRAADALARLEASTAALAGRAHATLSAEEREGLIDVLVAEADLMAAPDDTVRHDLSLRIFRPSPTTADSLAPQLLAELEDYLAQRREQLDARVELELALADGFLGYAYDMRWFNRVWYDESLTEDDVIFEGAVREVLIGAFDSGRKDGFEPVLAALEPHHDQYPRLVEAHRRYRTIAAAGGWPTDLEEARLRRGREHDIVPRLRERLHIEGYFDGDLASPVYSSDVQAALEAYQNTHQFGDDGQLEGGVVDSLNRSATYRAQQLAVTLQLWRESEIGDDEYYIFVNPNDFHAEVWNRGERGMRFRTIVGATNRAYSGRWLRATPELHERLRYIVFNPYWNVPQGIMTREYDPNLEEDPLWYENNGFEVMFNENGTRWVRQLPGPGNALGMVKFLFPNEHDVYMHDTPNRRLFRRVTRAFSHGCVRVEDPFDFAEYLLEQDRGWDRDRIDEYRAEGVEEWLTLRTPVDVHFEFYSVRIDDDGHANFLSDLYRNIRPRMAERLAQELALGVAESAPAQVLALGLAESSVESAPPPEQDASPPGGAASHGVTPPTANP